MVKNVCLNCKDFTSDVWDSSVASCKLSHYSVMCLLLNQLSSDIIWFARYTTASPSSPVKYPLKLTLQAGEERRHDRLFIMTAIIRHTFIYCSKHETNVPRSCAVKKKCFWHLTTWQGLSVFFLPTERDRLIDYDQFPSREPTLM